MAVLYENLVSLSPTPIRLRNPPPSAPIIQESQDETGIVYRVQDGLARFRDKCQTTWKSWNYDDIDKEKDELQSLLLKSRENDSSGSEVQLRPSKEWVKRLSDYQFLSGKDEGLPKRQTLHTIRARRHSALAKVPPHTRRSANLGYKCSGCEMVVDSSCLNRVQRCDCSVRPEPPIIPSNPRHGRPSEPYPPLLKFPWWVGRMTRLDAEKQLDLQPCETFLIRWSDRRQKLVLSLKIADDVKHMRVLRHELPTRFYLSETKYFPTVESLVNFYQQNCLSECFPDLFAKLSRPLYNTAVARFRYQGPGASYLSLEVDDQVIVINKDGERNGWWKGRIEERTGYFPMGFVQEENNLYM